MNSVYVLNLLRRFPMMIFVFIYITLFINMIVYGIIELSMNVHVQSNCKVAT